MSRMTSNVFQYVGFPACSASPLHASPHLNSMNSYTAKGFILNPSRQDLSAWGLPRLNMTELTALLHSCFRLKIAHTKYPIFFRLFGKPPKIVCASRVFLPRNSMLHKLLEVKASGYLPKDNGTKICPLLEENTTPKQPPTRVVGYSPLFATKQTQSLLHLPAERAGHGVKTLRKPEFYNKWTLECYGCYAKTMQLNTCLALTKTCQQHPAAKTSLRCVLFHRWPRWPIFQGPRDLRTPGRLLGWQQGTLRATETGEGSS